MISDNDQLARITLCPPQDGSSEHSKPCLERTCQEPNCGVAGIDRHTEKVLESCGDREISWRKWMRERIQRDGKADTSRMTLKEQSGTLNDMIREMKSEASLFALLLFVAKWQQCQFVKLNKNVPQNTAVVHMDFSENFGTFFQNEIQSAHWTKIHVTLHPIVAYYRCNADNCDDNRPVQEVIIVISQDLQHDHHVVQAFYEEAMRLLQQERGLHLEKMIEFTDGASSQYQSKGPFVYISFGESDFAVKRERNFFGSCHGKGPCDGAGGVVKTATRRAIVRGQAIISDANDMYMYCRENLTRPPDVDGKCNHSRRTFVVVNNINRNRPERAITTTLRGTRAFHSVKGISEGLVVVRNLSCFCESCASDDVNHGCEHQSHVSDWKVKRLNLHQVQVPRRVIDAVSNQRDLQDTPAVDAVVHLDNDEDGNANHAMVEDNIDNAAAAAAQNDLDNISRTSPMANVESLGVPIAGHFASETTTEVDMEDDIHSKTPDIAIDDIGREVVIDLMVYDQEESQQIDLGISCINGVLEVDRNYVNRK